MMVRASHGASQHSGRDWPSLIIAFVSVITAVVSMGALVFTSLSFEETKRGQITERFSKAVEQLGSQGPSVVDVRLGGIYSLEQITHDSPKDQATVLAVLAAFVRDHAPAPGATQQAYDVCTKGPVPTDVQAAITVLGRRDPQYDANTTIDLNSTCLSQVDFTKANLSGARLTQANLVHAKLVGANLLGAHLEFANLNDADLTGDTELANADLTNAKLNHTHLAGAHLVGANLKDATNQSDGADFSGADLNGAHLADAHLVNAHFKNAQLTGADLTGADLTGADLTGARK